MPIIRTTITTERTPTDMELLQRNLEGFRDATWTTGDGSRIRVQAMSDSHLHYALAKAHRGEYPDSVSRNTGIAALKAEAARRLLRIWTGKL